MPKIKYTAFLFSIILLFVLLSFLFFGVTNKVPISEDYNVPIAKDILSGRFINLQTADVYQYSPSSSNVILAPFIQIGFPNLFGVVDWVGLFFSCFYLGKTFKLNGYLAFIFAASFCMTTAIVRAISDQSIDKWLCMWFVLSVILLENPRRTLKYSFLLGLTSGMLIGTKYSGPLFFLPLILVYGRTFFRFTNPLRFLVTLLPFIFFGLSWYIRNFIIKGNPYFPANLPFFKGAEGYTQQSWFLWRIPFEYPKAIIPLLNAFFSEYMIWAFSGLVIIWFLIYVYRKRQPIDGQLLRLIILGILLGFVSFFLPITPPQPVALFHLVSDMRYVLIYMMTLILTVFIIAEKYKKSSLVSFVALLNVVPLFSFVPYQPKIFIIWLILIILFYFKRPSFLDKIYKLL